MYVENCSGSAPKQVLQQFKTYCHFPPENPGALSYKNVLDQLLKLTWTQEQNYVLSFNLNQIKSTYEGLSKTL